MNDVVLNITTDTPRQHITINRKAYQLKHRDEFSLLGMRRLSALGTTIAEIEAIEKPTDADEKKYQGVLRDFASAVIIGVTPAVLQPLRTAHLTDIVRVFFGKDPKTQQPAATAGPGALGGALRKAFAQGPAAGRRGAKPKA